MVNLLIISSFLAVDRRNLVYVVTMDFFIELQIDFYLAHNYFLNASKGQEHV